MKLREIKNRRYIDYYHNVMSEDIPKKVYSGSDFDVYKLEIKERHIVTNVGELNYLIRERSNTLKYIIVYCFMDEPEQIKQVSYYINNKVQLDSSEVVTVDQLVDPEKAGYYVMDFIENYVSKNYTLLW